jgi:hypothetical protein
MKSLACWIGRHRWETQVEQGNEFKVCAVCGKGPRKVWRSKGRPVDGRDYGGGGPAGP